MKILFKLMVWTLLAPMPFAWGHADSAYSHDSTISHSNADWMASVSGSKRLKDLSLPGTHDTMSFYGGDIVQTQSMSLATQLAAGIRVLDIRCRNVNNRFLIYHGIAYQYANFDDVLTTVVNFLHAHPTETILMPIQEERAAIDSTMSFADVFDSYANHPSYSNYFWRSRDPNPTLDAVRGKIVLIPNFRYSAFGLDSSTFNMQNSWVLQTNWDLYDKWTKVKNHLISANNSDPATRSFYWNGLTASTGSFPYFVASGHSSNGTSAPRLSTGLTTPLFNSWYPDFPRVACFLGMCTIAFEGINTLANNYINAAGLKFVGILTMDFPGMGLIDTIIRLNSDGVFLYEHANYVGRAQTLPVGRHNIYSLSIGNDVLSSLRVPMGWKVTLYEHADFQGRAKILTSDSAFLSDFNDLASSVVVEKMY